jgi:HlyD family secretion protein
VQHGTLIAVLDQWRQELERDRAAVNVAQSRQALTELQRGQNVSAIRAAEAAVDNAGIQHEQAKREQARIADLHRQGFAADRELEDADRAVELAHIALDKARKDLQQLKDQGNPDAIRAAQLQVQSSQVILRQAERELGTASLVSPIDGTILEKFVSEGDTVIGTNNSFGEGTTLISIADLTNVQVRTSVDEVDIGRLTEGLAALITVDSYPGEEFKGTITNIYPQGIASAGVTSFIVIVDVPNTEGKLLSNMTASVNITAQTIADIILVPFESIRSDVKGNPIVFVPGEEFEPEERPVTLGATDFKQIQILTGITAGEQVMVENLPQKATVAFEGGGSFE